MKLILQTVSKILKFKKSCTDWPGAFLLTTQEAESSQTWFSQNHKGNYGHHLKPKKAHVDGTFFLKPVLLICYFRATWACLTKQSTLSKDIDNFLF